jgi:L-lactate dehydrogenase complex protein LldG
VSNDARSEILASIRFALNAGGTRTHSQAATIWEALPRSYEQLTLLSTEKKLDLFEDRLREYDAELTRVIESEISEAVAVLLARRGNRPTLVPQGFPERWRPKKVILTQDVDFTAQELDRFDGVLSGATLAIAETGTLLLQNVPGQGRRAATLVPDFHLCVVHARDVVKTVPEAFARLADTAGLPTTFVSGPSATADIEMTRIRGVHGPRVLHVLLVTDPKPMMRLTASPKIGHP